MHIPSAEAHDLSRWSEEARQFASVTEGGPSEFMNIQCATWFRASLNMPVMNREETVIKV